MVKNKKRNSFNKLIRNARKKEQIFLENLNALGLIKNRLTSIYFDNNISCAIGYNDLGKWGKYLMPIFCFKMTQEDMRKGFRRLCVNKLKGKKGEKISKNRRELLKHMQGIISFGLKSDKSKNFSDRSIGALLGKDKKTIKKYSKYYSSLSKEEQEARRIEAMTLKKIPDVDVCDMRTVSMDKVEPFLSTKGILKSRRKLRHKTNQ